MGTVLNVVLAVVVAMGVGCVVAVPLALARIGWEVYRRLFDESGQDAAEYAIMLAVVLAVAIGVIKLMGLSLDPIWNGVASKISGGQ